MARIDSQISPDSRESFQGSRTEPLSCESRFGGLKVANRRFEAIRANRSHVARIGVSLRIDSRESSRFALRIAGPSKYDVSKCVHRSKTPILIEEQHCSRVGVVSGRPSWLCCFFGLYAMERREMRVA